MTADATTSLFIQYQTPLVLSPVVLKLTLQRQTWDQRPCSRLIDAFLKAARPSLLKAAAFSQGRAPRVEDIADAQELVLTDEKGATVTADAPVSELTKGAAVARAALRPRPSAPSTPTRTQKKKVHWSPNVVEKSRPPAVGLVCTLRDASKRLDSFIRYHQRVGFARIYLYFDDASETADIEAARGYADVEVIVRDDALAEAWARLPGWAALKDYVQDDVQVRQMLNALHCLRRAEARDRLQWLVHVDSDELFDPGARSIHDHGASTAVSSPRKNDLVKNHRVHRTLLDFHTGRKYETLGAFPNSCVAGTVHHEPDTFHCKCRDAFLTGGPPALAALFERCVVLDDAREARRGLEAGVLERVRIAKF